MIDYINQSPIIPLVFSGLLVLIIIMQCLTKRRISFPKLLFSIFLTFASGLILFFFSEIKKLDNQVPLIVTYFGMIAIEIAVFVMLFISLDTTFVGESFQKALTKSLDETKLYVILDRKDRVKDMSECFLKDLGVSYHDVSGKNIFDVIELKYRLVGINGEKGLKNDIKDYYNHYESKAKPNTKNTLELEMQDDNAATVAYYLNESVIFSNDKYRGRILIGDKKSEDNLMGLERDEFQAKSELNLIKERFQTLLSKTKDGVFFNTLSSDSIWLNDTLVKKLNLNSNNMTSTEFYNLINPNDQKMYGEVLGHADKNGYKISYDFNTGAGYVHVLEEGNKISTESSVELCGVMTVFDNDGYEKTGTGLDNIKSEKDLKNLLMALYRENKVYQLAYIKIGTIPEINEKFGRMVGNYCISEFVQRFANEYTPEGTVYRVSGLEFVAVIPNFNRIEALKATLRKDEKPLHLIMNYGNEKVKIDSSLGLCMSTESATPEDVLRNAKMACKYASNPQFLASYCDYKDMR